MAGIAGCWNLDGAPARLDQLEKMSAPLRHRARDGEAMHIEGPVGVTCQHLWVTPEEVGERQPLTTSAGVVLAFDGRLDNRRDLLDHLTLDVHASDAALVLAGYERWGDRTWARLSGDFAAAVFDRPRQTLTLVRDAIGIRPLYYFHTSRLCVFASEIKALLAHPDVPCRPDDEGVADFMLIGSRPLDRQHLTCFAGISAVVPAHRVTVSGEALAAERYWDFDTTRPLRFRSPQEYVEAFRERFVEAIRRRVRTAYPVACSVSGGLDSSSVFCQAMTLARSHGASGAPPHGLSYVSSRRETDEQQFLGDIERRFGTVIDRFDIEPRLGLVRDAATQLRTIEAPFVDCMWGVTREVHARAAATGARTLMTGHWGDQMLFSTAYLIDLLRRGRVVAAWEHTRQWRRYFGAQEAAARRRAILSDAVRYHVPEAIARPLKWVRLRALDAIRPDRGWFDRAFLRTGLRDRYRLATFEGRFHSAHARALYIEARSKYQVQCMAWNAKVAALHGLDVSFPFLDRDLIQFMMSIPGEMHACDGVPRSLLRDAMRGGMPDSICDRTWKSDFSRFVNEGLSEDAGVIGTALHRRCLAVQFGYLDPDRLAPEVARLTARLNGPDCTDSWELGDTYGLEMWLQVFFTSDKGAPHEASYEAARRSQAAVSRA